MLFSWFIFSDRYFYYVCCYVVISSLMLLEREDEDAVRFLFEGFNGSME